jgi:hypothetical protein
MASIISAGTTSGTALNMAGDTSGVLQLATNGSTTAVTIDAAQKIAVNGSDATVGGGQMVINQDANNGLVINTTASGSGAGIYLRNTVDSTINNFYFTNPGVRFYDIATAAERMRIDTSGNVGVGNTSPSARLDAKGADTSPSNFTLIAQNSTGTIMLRTRNDGYLGSPVTYSNTTANGANVNIDAAGYLFRSTSSIKYKTDVQDAIHGLSDVMKLRSVTYKGINDGDTIFGGLIAEEVHEAGLTEFVQYAEDGTPDALAYGQMISLAFKAIQEQQVIINDLKARITALEGAA